MSTSTLETSSEQETAAAGERLAASVRPGTIILLQGGLGAGKTAFVRGLVRGLGAPPEEVSSPTFTLIQEYRGRLPVYHVDLYRLEPHEVADLGLDEILAGDDSVVAVEWPDRWIGRPATATYVEIETVGEDRRRLTIRTAD